MSLIICYGDGFAGVLNSQSNSQVIKWQDWSDTVFEQAGKENRFVFIFGSADWCHWCKKMESTTFQNKTVIQMINANFIPVRVDFDKNKDIFIQYKIVSLPGLIILDANHQVKKMISGYYSPDDLIKNLKEISNRNIPKQSYFHITLIGERNNADTIKLYQAALTYRALGAEIEILPKGKKSAKFPAIEFPVLTRPAAFVCTQNHCSLPAYNAKELANMISNLRKNTSETTNVVIADDNQNETEKLLFKKNLFLTLSGFWGIGILLAFTPCILPLIIIMVSFLGGRTGEISRQKAIYLTLTYIVTLSLTYAVAGIIAALFGFYVQAYFQHTWILVGFSFIFVILALSLLGFYKLQLPEKWRHKIVKYNKFQENYSYLQAAIMGILATLIASPCAAAPLIGVLSYVGKTGDVELGALSLFFVGLGIGTPLLIATAIGTNFLPKMHEIQEGIKTFFGLILLGIGIWLIEKVIPDWWSMMLWSALVIYTSILMSNLHRTQENNIWKIWKTLSYMVLAYGIAIFIGGLFGNTNPLKPLHFKAISQDRNTLAETTFSMINNMTGFEQAVHTAKIKHKPIMLIFTAEWCESCKEMEQIFLSYDLKNVMQHFILLQITITGSNIDLAKKFNVIAPPEILFFDSKGNKLDLHFNGDINTESLNGLLEKALKISRKYKE